MRMLTKILPLLLSAVPMTVLAMEMDDTIPVRSKKNNSSISAAEEESKPASPENLSIEWQETIDLLEQVTESGKPLYKGSEKYKKINELKESIEFLKKIDPQHKEAFSGDNYENLLSAKEAELAQLIATYCWDFFKRIDASDFDSTKDLSPEIINHILSNCTKEDLINVIKVSNAARDAVYRSTAFQNHFGEHFQKAAFYGKYISIDEFISDFRRGTPRAYAAAGIMSILSKQNSSNPYGISKTDTRNKWLDIAFDARDPLAVTFILHNKLYKSSQGQDDDNLLKVIEETYLQLGVTKDYLLDTQVLNFFENELASRAILGKVQGILNILKKQMSHSVAANFMLWRIYSEWRIQVNETKATKYYEKALEAIDQLPDDLKGKAYSEIGLSELIKELEVAKFKPDSQIIPFQKTYNQWEHAIDAWTKAEKGDRQKAVARFSSFIVDNNSSDNKSQPYIYGAQPLLSFPTEVIFLSKNKLSNIFRMQILDVNYKFLEALYEKDKQGNDQLRPYHRDVNMLLHLAKGIWEESFAASMPPESGLGEHYQHQYEVLSHYFTTAIQESLLSRDAQIKEEVTDELKTISEAPDPLITKVRKYKSVAQKIGLIKDYETANYNRKDIFSVCN